MPAGIFLTVRDIQTLQGLSYSQAWSVYDNIRYAIGKKAGKKITIEDYAKYQMVPVELVEKTLNAPAKKFGK